MTVIVGPPPEEISCDVCIVGTGPVGIALALECERHGLKVLALEAGGTKSNWWERTNNARIQDPATHVALHRATRLAFGGTSWAWSGACVRFDDLDFQSREYVPFSGWPISHNDLAPFYQRAASILHCLPLASSAQRPQWSTVETKQVCTPLQPRLARTYFAHFAKSERITLCLRSPVIGLEFDEAGSRVSGVKIRTPAGSRRIGILRLALAAGGLRSTQLLLASQRELPKHFGGSDGPLGRYYMGHLTGSIAAINFHDPADAHRLRPRYVNGKGWAPWRFTPSGSRQLSERILNTAFWPAAPLLHDPAHADGALSAAFLLLTFPVLNQWLAARDLSGSQMLAGRRIPHLKNIMREPLRTGVDVIRALVNKARSKPSIETLVDRAQLCTYSLQYHAESEPNPDSRVTLRAVKDCLGLPRMEIDLRFSDRDVESVVRAHELIDEELQATGKGHLEYLIPRYERMRRVREQARDGYHQMGTTRMGQVEKYSVVDPNCRVHGVSNLFIASTSVFPTSGHANPTLLATALAVRLAEHLGEQFPRSP